MTSYLENCLQIMKNRIKMQKEIKKRKNKNDRQNKEKNSRN